MQNQYILRSKRNTHCHQFFFSYLNNQYTVCKSLQRSNTLEAYKLVVSQEKVVHNGYPLELFETGNKVIQSKSVMNTIEIAGFTFVHILSREVTLSIKSQMAMMVINPWPDGKSGRLCTDA